MILVKIDPSDVFPVADSRTESFQASCGNSPFINGNIKPVRSGRYLRYLKDSKSFVWSWFVANEWRISKIVRSSNQGAPWVGVSAKLFTINR